MIEIIIKNVLYYSLNSKLALSWKKKNHNTTVTAEMDGVALEAVFIP